LACAVLCAALLLCFSTRVSARVSGECSNCHTMHNSQNGNPVDSDGPNNQLTIDNCVGCHSSSSSDTILTLGASNFPIVFNSSQPTAPLAGGNFYWIVDQSDHRLAHNVQDISGPDSNITYVPGRHIGSDYTLTITDCYNCHTVGFPPGYPGIPFTIARSGDVLICQDCHTQVMHHADDSATVVDGTGGWYRFLYEVKGIEDPDWQKTVSPSDHNEYQGETVAFGNSISDKGCACHGDFHALKNPGGVGSGSPWLRHPVDVALPSTGEYTSYTAYNPVVPVGRPDLSGYTGPSSTVTPGTDQVICVSCHRSHGTDQPDLLRWDYSTIIAGGGANSAGCFICHSTKDENP
jgi:predicted CXXCH cytochrome family protein